MAILERELTTRIEYGGTRVGAFLDERRVRRPHDDDARLLRRDGEQCVTRVL